ncbi:MAG: HlyD family efflux transporter periplasmic adaptor subunit [Victivallales bacterium]|nr:HlyD family efflux transporter periplasmic adaptor subunit [Victivallales bacterium]
MKKIIKWIIILAIVATGGWFGYRKIQENKENDSKPMAAKYTSVKRGPLIINLIEYGNIKPRKQHVIKSQVEGRVSITYIFPEGERVKKGEVLFKLESSSFEDKLATQEITAKNADASCTQARENLAVVKNQADADREKAELNLRFAKEDLIKYKEGEYPKTLNEAESKVILAKEELKRAEDKLEWSTKLFAEKYLSESDYRTDALSCKRYQLDVKSAENALNLLKDYTYKRQIAQLESDAKQAEMTLERTIRKGNADVTQATATLAARELELKRQNEQLERWRDQIGKCTVVAPADGLVIYATSNQGPFRRQNQEPFDVGTEVYQRQDVIYLPEGDDFNAEIKIHETNLKKIYIGLPVRITVDALKNQEFIGHISKVAPLPDAQSMFMNPDLKLYNAEATIDDSRELLKSGMNCRAEIIIEQHDDVLYVPVQCVVREGGKPVVYVKTPMGEVARTVEIGLDNNQFVHIKNGLEEGEEVSLVPPLDKADKVDSSSEPQKKKFKIPERPAEDAAGSMNGFPSMPGGGRNWPPRNGNMPGANGQFPRRAPGGGMPGGGMPGGGMPGGGMPGGGMPGGGMPSGGRPAGGMPPAGSTTPAAPTTPVAPAAPTGAANPPAPAAN